MAFVEEVKGKVFLITGGAGGLGSGMAKAFLEEGAKHVAILDVDENEGKILEKNLKEKFGEDKVKFHKCDVTKDDQLFAAFENTYDEHGSLDVVINNAGLLNDREDIYKKEIEINVTALVTGTLKAMKMMGKDNGGKGGTVINISSVSALFISPVLPIYHATKSAVLMFSSSIGLSPIYERTGVRVLTICFGATETKLFDDAYKNKGGFDASTSKELQDQVIIMPYQKPESAIRGVLEAYKYGLSGETWLAIKDKPAVNITSNVKQAYGILTAVAGFEEHLNN